jgi:uncharacterized protein YdiU (UPF0061 family)
MTVRAMPHFAFDNSYARELPGTYVEWRPAAVPAPRWLFLNGALAVELGLDAAALQDDAGAALFAGNALPQGAQPIAQAYAGHQFGGFSPQLGDGRALLVGELLDRSGKRRDIACKGSGRTPFSRGGDGKAAVGPMLREVLIGEAMHALGIPTTRALAEAATGEPVYREQVLPGAVLTRVAASHLRVGTFQYFAARGDVERLKSLVDYAIARHDPALIGDPDRVMGLLRSVARRQAALIAQWMNVGFIHGVMNTDNMTISGETIDYGPCAFLEAYDPQTVFSSIDHDGRYAYGNQPHIARWNLARLAEALLPLVADAQDEAGVQRAVARATEVIDAFPAWFEHALLQGQRAKLGLHPAGTGAAAQDADDAALANDWLALLHAQGVDFTLAWRRLADAAEGDEAPLRALFPRDTRAPDGWLARWRVRCAMDDAAASILASAPALPPGSRRGAGMRAVSPSLIARNHLVEQALDAATAAGDLGPFQALLSALGQPFDAYTGAFAEPAPAAVTERYRTFCGT